MLLMPSPAIQSSPSRPNTRTPDLKTWSQALSRNDWETVLEQGSPFLNKPCPPSVELHEWNRFQGFTWFAYYRCHRPRKGAWSSLFSIRKASELIPDQDEVWYELGAELNRERKSVEALTPLREYLRRAPGNFDGRYELSYALNALEQCKESLSVLEPLHLEFPKSALVANELGFALNHLRRPSEALTVLEQGLLQEATMSGWAEKSISLRMLERWEEAKVALEEAIRLGLDPELGETQKRQIKGREKVEFRVLDSGAVTRKGP